MTIASEAGHWYSRSGEPYYEIVGKNGKLRPTTLRDARKLDLVPSVSGIIRAASAPALDHWRVNQHLIVAADTPRDPEEGDQAWMDRVVTKTKEKMDKAPDLGTAIHADIERSLTDAAWFSANLCTRAAIDELWQWCGADSLRTERSFAHPLGYGGKVDVHKEGYVADFKTKEFTELDLPKTWDNHAMQLAAYRRGLGLDTASCAIIFVSTSVPGLTHLVEIPEEELHRGWFMFENLLRYWQVKNRYYTMFEKETEECLA